MKTTYERIQEIINAKKQSTAKELRETLGVSQVLIHRHLKKLCTEGKIQKVGSSPRVFYTPVIQKKIVLPKNASKIVENNWLEILPNGNFIFGNAGFALWCKERSFDFSAKAQEFEKMYFKKESYKKDNLINATEKITGSFETNFLEKVWYVDFYSWEIFGKTLLGKLILYAKQNSNEKLMRIIAERIKDPLLELIDRENFNFIGTVPHSVPRKKDFLKTTLGFLEMNPPPQRIFSKVFSGYAVAQKMLKSKKEREQNAKETLFLEQKSFPEKILLVDDACGSGATLNISAQKIKECSPKTQVFGLTFVGSIKGFEVIAET